MTPPPARADTRLVGRDAVLGVLDRLVTRLDDGASGLTVVTGTMGSGRSAVLDWAVARAGAAGIPVAVARCSRRESRIPYATLTQLLATLCPPSRIAELAGGLPSGTRPTAAVARMCDAALEDATGRPVMLAVDDLHLADPDSLRRLISLAERPRSGPVLTVVTSPLPLRHVRSTAGVRDSGRTCPVNTLRLDPLTDDEARTLLASRAWRPAPASAAAVNAVAGGAPAVLCTVADRFAASGPRTRTDALPGLTATARAVWSARALSTAQGLADDAMDVLRVVAAVGHLLDTGGAAAVAGLDAAAFEEAVDALRACGLLAGNGPPRLSRPWFADEVLAGMTPAERDILHLKAAAVRGGGRTRIGTVADMLGAVSGVVRPRTAPDDAQPGRIPADVTADALRHALGESVTEADRARLLLKLAAVEAVTAPQAGDGRLRQIMLRHVTPQTWPVVLHAADLLLSRGDAETTRWMTADVHQRALASIPDAQLRPLRALGRLAWNEKGGPPLGASPPVHSDHPGHPAEAAVLAWNLAVRADDSVRARALARTALAAPAAVPLMCRIAAARTLLCAADVDGGLRSLDAVVVEARRAGAHAAAAQALLARAEAAVRLGGSEDALGALAAATRELPPSSWHALLSPRLTAAEVLALIRCGRVAEAREVAARARVRREDRGVAFAFLLYARAELALIGGDAERALLLLEECGRLLRSRRWLNPMLIPWRSTAAAAHRRLGSATAAAECLAGEDRDAELWGTADAFAGTRSHLYAVLARSGVDVPRAPDEPAESPEPADDRQLTDAERAVAGLVVCGLGNREIAERLGLSTRTVELRLTKIYRRLGVRGRSALVAHLRGGQEND
ncbi:hypothetical protein AQJ66_29680 [Streptomyces bungoensis]|uniref:HTH luxR-type domain-containing protein n=1 Tax=Streptomyces bungoensis TaxID=285568 RepID=A0A101SRV7_9ACTN|nr:LuxR family transcriptional regulator [Streptomyces bungoensis]KUN79045.1 hypothetical protein AQJ66_29680 [Streptomyces bungoensis]